MLFKPFVRYVENANHLIIPCVGDEHICAHFPNAKILTAVLWDKNGVYYNMNRDCFPNVKRINYLCGSPGGYSVLFRFFNGYPEFKWGVHGYPHRFFRDLREDCLEQLAGWEAKMYYTIASNETYCALWRMYLDDNVAKPERATRRPTPPSALA